MLRGAAPAAVSQPSTALTDRVSGTGAGSTAASPQGEFKSQTCSEGNRKVTSQVALGGESVTGTNMLLWPRQRSKAPGLIYQAREFQGMIPLDPSLPLRARAL